jgi:hypothetical protein
VQYLPADVVGVWVAVVGDIPADHSVRVALPPERDVTRALGRLGGAPDVVVPRAHALDLGLVEVCREAPGGGAEADRRAGEDSVSTAPVSDARQLAGRAGRWGARYRSRR